MGLLSLVTPPAVNAVDLDLVKSHLSVDFTDDDALIEAYIGAAVVVAEERLGKKLLTQTWAESFGTTSRKISLSVRPVQSVASVAYFDESNVLQTLDASSYELVSQEDFSYVESGNWPAIFDRADALTVNYVVGFGDAASDVPANVSQAILLLVGQYYLHRENVLDGKQCEPPQAFTDLINLSAGGWYG